jgi:hypothetical protein
MKLFNGHFLVLVTEGKAHVIADEHFAGSDTRVS